MDCSMPGLPVHHHLPELTRTHVHWVGDTIQPSHPLLSPSTPTFNLSQHQGLFQWVSSSHQVSKYWSFSFSISPCNEYSGLISFRMDWLDLLAVQGTLRSLLQHHSSKASILWHSAFFIVQLSHPYMTTGKTIALIWQAFVGKVMSLLFNMRSRLVITFLQVDFKGIILRGIMGMQQSGGWGGGVCSFFIQWLKKLKSSDWSFLRMKQFSLKATAWETLHETRHCWPALQIWVSRVQPGFPASPPAQRTSELSAPTSPWSNSLK